MRKKIKFAIASYTNKHQYIVAIAELSGTINDLLYKYQNKKNIYYISPILIEKRGNMWYGKSLDYPVLPSQPQLYTRSYFHWLCVLKLKILCTININSYY